MSPSDTNTHDPELDLQAAGRTGLEEHLAPTVELIDGSGPFIDDISDWLMAQALDEAPVPDLLEGTTKRLFAAGVPLYRTMVGVELLHPTIDSVGFTWDCTNGLRRSEYYHDDPDVDEAYQRSPFVFMQKYGLPAIRRRLTGPSALLDFPILEDLVEEGITDYLAYRITYGSRMTGSTRETEIAGSWATKRPTGFTHREIETLQRIAKRMAVAASVAVKAKTTKSVLETYLGPDAGGQVLNGSIRRGSGERIAAALWFSDLRQSTRLAEELGDEEFITALNAYFECTAGAVLEHGGEVPRFVGDAVLAIFPIRFPGGSAAEATRSAVTAAHAAEEKIKALNAAREAVGVPALDFGLGLHLGSVLFGNIGVPQRLEFSIIGPAANEAARIEDMTKELKRRVLMSAEFAKFLDEPTISMGTHQMRGVAEPMEVFAFANRKCASVMSCQEGSD